MDEVSRFLLVEKSRITLNPELKLVQALGV